MFAVATDGGDAFRRLVRAQENSYKVLDQFRLVATDYEGTEWACGWTRPEFKGIPKLGWPLTGKLRSLVTQASGPRVSTDSGVELVFQPKLRLPTEKRMMALFPVDGEEIERRYSAGQHIVHVLDSEITFSYPPSGDSLWVTAKTSDKLQHPYAENWISEPLRVLLGQLVFPRLVARNFGNGTAQVWLRPSPRHLRDSGIASLADRDLLGSAAKFWDLYASLLGLVAESKDEKGHPNFESHRITRLYEEIIQATQGSRWVLSMTLASTGEALARMMMSLRGLGEVARVAERKVEMYLRDLVQRGVLEKRHESAWSAVRHAVMHGNLVSPWATEEEDNRLLALAELVHRLTRELIRETAKGKEDHLRMSNVGTVGSGVRAVEVGRTPGEKVQE